jgi:hypothetical protein
MPLTNIIMATERQRNIDFVLFTRAKSVNNWTHPTVFLYLQLKIERPQARKTIDGVRLFTNALSESF